MGPTFWLAIQIKGRRIPLLLPLLFPLFLCLEILAIVPAAIYSYRKKDWLPIRIVLGFYLSRLMLVLMFYGRKFRVKICEGNERVYVGGRIPARVQTPR